MPERRTSGRQLERREPPSVELFEFGDGTWHFFPDCPVFPNRAAAERVWRRSGVRRQVWARTSRLSLPGGAKTYDGLTDGAWHHLWVAHHHATFDNDDLVRALQLLQADRDAVTAFAQREPAAAVDVAPYLVLWQSDLDTIEAAISLCAAGDGRWTSTRMHETHALLLPQCCYGLAVPGSGLTPVHGRSQEDG